MKKKVIITTLLFSIPAFLLGKIIWPPDPMGPTPTAAQLPFFIFLSVVESLIFGLGVSFIFYGWPMVKKVSGGSKMLTTLMFIALSWMLVSWWPHDNLHIHNGMNLQGLLYIEYGFHLTLIISGLILTYGFLTSLKEQK